MPKAEGQRKRYFAGIFLVMYLIWFFVSQNLEVRINLVVKNVLQTVQHNAYDQDPYAKEFGMNISEKLASVEARILPAPWVKNLNRSLNAHTMRILLC